MIIDEIKIKLLKVELNIDDKDYVITEVLYDLEITDSDTTESIRKPCILTPDFNNGEYVDYSSITEDDIKNWIKNDVKYILTLRRLTDSLNGVINKSTVNITDGNFPWQTTNTLDFSVK